MSFLSALEQFNEHRSTLKMTTGSADLDSLIDGIQEGLFYLFYGNNHVALDALVYTFLVNCVLPIKQKHGFESMAVCINNSDYYDPRRTAALNPEKIGIAAKCAGIDPKVIGIIVKACTKNKVALVCTGDANTTARGIIPRPIGGIYLKHVANVIVHSKEFSKTSSIRSFKATLIKHQYTKTPKSAVMYVRKAGGMMFLD